MTFDLVGRTKVRVVDEAAQSQATDEATADDAGAEFEAYWWKQISSAVKKVEVEDLGDMDADALWSSIPVEDSSGRGRQDLATIERDLAVKVVFCENRHVLLVGTKAKLQKKCFVLRNLLSHYHWRLSGRDVL